VSWRDTSIDALAKMIPVNPPTVNKKINPKDHIIRGDEFSLVPCRVEIHLNTFTPVGIAMIIVAVVK